MNDEQVFESYAPFIRDYIYKNGWENLREVQLEAAKLIFGTQDNILLSSATASGKTEAAFFPILSLMHDDMPDSVGVIYIAPLKSLINDQFGRIEQLLDEEGIPVYHWHGDVAASHKAKMMKSPRGVLQITPESLENMLMNRSADIPRLFGDLRFVVIDEIHTLMNVDRGNQIICLLERIRRITGKSARRIGLSATLGEPEKAAEWLGAGTGQNNSIIQIKASKIKWKLGVEHFYIKTPDTVHLGETGINQTPAKGTLDNLPSLPEVGAPAEVNGSIDEGYEYIYDCVKDKKSLVFSNSREETEYITATLRQIAGNRGEDDIFLIHHGNLSASIREHAEATMKDEEKHAVTCATVTMELGIDIGRLERVVQLDSPNSVSNFLQRLGRSGRRGQPPEMMMVFREEEPAPTLPLPQLIPWTLLKAIAIIQLYIEEKWIEPPLVKKMPMSLLYHQTLSVLASSGELSAARLAERIFSMAPFRHIEPEDYKKLLVSLIKCDQIQMTDEKGLIIGLAGERMINSYKFLAVFKDSEDFTVRCESEEIGTIAFPPPVGDRFALAGRLWEVEEIDISRKLIYVKLMKGKMEISWPGEYGIVHTKIVQRMKRVLQEDTEYPYLKPGALARLKLARDTSRTTGITERGILPLGGYSFVLFPWLGTISFRSLRRFLASESKERFKMSNIEFDGCYYMTFRMERGTDYELIKHLSEVAPSVKTQDLIGPNELPIFEKYDEYIPGDLLRKSYAVDKLRTDEFTERLKEILTEF
ncbi:MAG: DEAD/DEAH box helicase [Eubacteriales bacterium]